MENEIIKANDSPSIPSNFSNDFIIELVNFQILQIKNDIEYEFQITSQDEIWKIKRSYFQITELIQSLMIQKYVFLPIFNQNPYFVQANLKSVNQSIIDFLRFLNYRTDILSNSATQNFFDIQNREKIISKINSENTTNLFSINLVTNDLTLSDFDYDEKTGLFAMGLEDRSVLSSLGRFWSMIDFEILGVVHIFQKVIENGKQTMKKIVTKNFDVRVSKIKVSVKNSSIIVGLETGAIMIFKVNILTKPYEDESNEVLININEGHNFKHFNERIVGIEAINEAFVAVSKDNKINVIEFGTANEIIFSGSIRKRLEGKGIFSDLKFDEIHQKLYILTNSKHFIIYDIHQTSKFNENSVSPDYKLEYLNEYKSNEVIQSVFIKNSVIYLGLKNKVLIVKYDSKSNDFDCKEIQFNGNMDKSVSYSAKYLHLASESSISVLCYFGKLKVFIFGLSNGVVFILNSKNLEIEFAKKISDSKITKITLHEEKSIFVIGDENSITYFFQLFKI